VVLYFNTVKLNEESRLCERLGRAQKRKRAGTTPLFRFAHRSAQPRLRWSFPPFCMQDLNMLHKHPQESQRYAADDMIINETCYRCYEGQNLSKL